jgi:serine/threonine protein kinase
MISSPYDEVIVLSMELTALGLEVVRQLGSGSFAKVYECFDQREGKSYAVKVEL